MSERYITPQSPLTEHIGEIDIALTEAELQAKQQELFQKYGFSLWQRVTLPESYDNDGFGSTAIVRGLDIANNKAPDELDHYGLDVLTDSKNNGGDALRLTVSLREIIKLNPKLELPKQK